MPRVTTKVIQSVARIVSLLDVRVLDILISSALQKRVGPLKPFVLVLPGFTEHTVKLAPQVRPRHACRD